MCKYGDQLTSPRLAAGLEVKVAPSQEERAQLKESMLMEWIGYIRGTYKRPKPRKFKELTGGLLDEDSVPIGADLHFCYRLQPKAEDLNAALLSIGLCSAGGLTSKAAQVKRGPKKVLSDKSKVIAEMTKEIHNPENFEYGDVCEEPQGSFVFLFPGWFNLFYVLQ